MQPSFSLIFSTLIHFLYPFIQLGYNLQHNLDINTVEVHEDLQIRKVPMLRDPLSVPRSDRDDLWRKEVLQQHQWMNLWEKTMVVKPKHPGGGPVRLGLSNLSIIEADMRSRTWQIHLDHMAIQDLRQCMVPRWDQRWCSGDGLNMVKLCQIHLKNMA
jgi:hypothetical protein